MSGITRLHHVSLVVSDTRRALDFYSGILGLQEAERPALSFPGAWLQIGEQQIHLLEVENPDPVAPRPGHAGRDRHTALLVDDLDGLRRRLDRAGVACTWSRSGRRALFCRDPDGNACELIAAG
jgi:glyoxylase I family protein